MDCRTINANKNTIGYTCPGWIFATAIKTSLNKKRNSGYLAKENKMEKQDENKLCWHCWNEVWLKFVPSLLDLDHLAM